MIPFKIGNWLINQNCIKWDGKPEIDYEIAIDRLTEETGENIGKTSYDWLVHMAEKTWIKREDIYALNTAFIYAMEYFKIPFEENMSFVKTFIEQEGELNSRKK